MSEDPIQVSAYVSRGTKARLDEYVREHGTKKSYVIERALLDYIDRSDEVPYDAVIPSRIVVDAATYDRLRAMADEPAGPTESLLDLMSGRPASD